MFVNRLCSQDVNAIGNLRDSSIIVFESIPPDSHDKKEHTGTSSQPNRNTMHSWPTRVACAMNIIEWENQLKNFNLVDRFGFLLEGFKHGFHQGIPTHTLKELKWFCPPNHSSALVVKDKIMKNIENELVAGRMFGPYDKQTVYANLGFFRTSPLGAVENSDKSFRPINDFSYPRNDPMIPSVNSFVDKDEFETTWDDFKIVAKFFRNLGVSCLI